MPVTIIIADGVDKQNDFVNPEYFDIGGGGIPSTIELSMLLGFLTDTTYKEWIDRFTYIQDDPKFTSSPMGSTVIIPAELFKHILRLSKQKKEKILKKWSTIREFTDYNLDAVYVEELFVKLEDIAKKVQKSKKKGYLVNSF
jgi:hypothetical protein